MKATKAPSVTVGQDEIWHAVMTVGGSEFYAQFHLQCRDYQNWLPWELERRRYKMKGGYRYALVRTAYFPSYLFVRVGDDQDVAGINEAPGVSRVVYCGDKPMVIDPVIMGDLKAMGDPWTGYVGERDGKAPTRYAPGSLVRFVEPSHVAGMEGIVQICTKNEITVYVDAIGRQLLTRVELLEPI